VKAQQAVLALEADLRQLAISNRDYSEWDDGYDYVLERDDTIDQAFVRTLLTDEAMRRSSRPLNTRRGYGQTVLIRAFRAGKSA
jgi:sensor domain CHASE-containing protein